MSILQEYKAHERQLGYKKIKAVYAYLGSLESLGVKKYYSDIIYNKSDWEKFEKWFKEVYNDKYGRSPK